MNELQMLRMKSDASNSLLRCLRWIVFSVADDRMTNGRKLDSDLILQSGHQRNSDQRSSPERALDGIPEFSPRRPVVALSGQPLEHSFPSKVVDQRPLCGA